MGPNGGLHWMTPGTGPHSPVSPAASPAPLCPRMLPHGGPELDTSTASGRWVPGPLDSQRRGFLARGSSACLCPPQRGRGGRQQTQRAAKVLLWPRSSQIGSEIRSGFWTGVCVCMCVRTHTYTRVCTCAPPSRWGSRVKAGSFSSRWVPVAISPQSPRPLCSATAPYQTHR